MENINDSYFNGLYKNIWRSYVPEELTEKETDFIFEYFKLQRGKKVLDLMCGYGRHTLALGRKGIVVTAIDNLADYIEEIRGISEKEKLSVKAIKIDAIKYKSNEVFDLVICMGNSLNFFNSKDIVRLLSTISSQLKKGGYLLIHTWSLTEIAVKDFIEKSWSRIDGLMFLSDSKFLFQPTRIESETFIISPDVGIESKMAIDYIFSVAEMEVMLNKTGFNLNEIYSIPGRKKFKIGEPRAYIVAEKK